VRARALALERLVKEPTVPEAGQGVRVGEPSRLAIAERIVERRNGATDDLVDVGVERSMQVEAGSRDDGEQAERAELAG
jgi:hypothetical protein